jgi:hypothetical protein
VRIGHSGQIATAPDRSVEQLRCKYSSEASHDRARKHEPENLDPIGLDRFLRHHCLLKYLQALGELISFQGLAEPCGR